MSQRLSAGSVIGWRRWLGGVSVPGGAGGAPTVPPRAVQPGHAAVSWLGPDATGGHGRALDYYEQALPIRREVGDRAGEATTLNNIGRVYDGLGDGSGRSTTTSRRCPSGGRSGTGPARPPR